MGQLLDNINLAANGTPYGGRVSIDPERIHLAREYQRKGQTMNYDFTQNISTLKHLLTLLEHNGYSNYTVKCVRDTIQYLEEREKESK